MAKLQPVGRLTARQVIWTAMRELAQRQGTFTQRDVRDATGVRWSIVREFTVQLVEAGLLSQAWDGTPGKPAHHGIQRDVGVEAPRFVGGRIDEGSTGQERMWGAMKALRDFAIADLQLAAEIAKPATVRAYVRGLLRAGYLQEAGDRRWRLLQSKNTGPRPPAVRRNGTVIDLNLGREMRP